MDASDCEALVTGPGWDAWIGRECHACKVPPGVECKPHDGRGLIHGQRTDGPRYPFGPPTPEQVEAERLRREASRAVATAETAVCKVEQLTIEW